MLRKFFLFIGISGIVIAGGLYTKQKFLGPKYRLTAAAAEIRESEIRDGDLIFQTWPSGQSLAIQLATHSRYSHCGIIFKQGGEYFVCEAVQPVRKTRLDKWIANGQDGHFVIKRLKNADQVLTGKTLDRMKQVGESFIGKNYDIYFSWSDENIYCSELVWKIYKRAAGIEIGKLEKLRDFDLTNEVVKQTLEERYGQNVPLDETVISPVSIFDSDLLTTIKSSR